MDAQPRSIINNCEPASKLADTNGVFTDRARTLYTDSDFIESTGESGVGKNMPPYLAVTAWKRIE